MKSIQETINKSSQKIKEKTADILQSAPQIPVPAGLLSGKHRKVRSDRGYFETNGARLYYEISGAGLPILLLHGNQQSHHVFHSYASKLQKSYQVILMDSRGHGHSQLLCSKAGHSAVRKKEFFTIQDMARDAASLLDHLGISKVILFGYSDGANIALEFASLYPERTLAVISASGNALPHGLIFPVRLGTLMLGSVLTLAQRVLPSGKLHQQLGSQLQMNTLLTDSPKLSPGRLQKIQAPVLLLAGTHDLIKTSHTQWMAEQIPHSQLCLLTGGTHNVLFSQEQTCLGKILYFLKENNL